LFSSSLLPFCLPSYTTCVRLRATRTASPPPFADAAGLSPCGLRDVLFAHYRKTAPRLRWHALRSRTATGTRRRFRACPLRCIAIPLLPAFSRCRDATALRIRCRDILYQHIPARLRAAVINVFGKRVSRQVRYG